MFLKTFSFLKLLQFITSHSPELAFYGDRTLTDVAPTPASISDHDEKAIIRMINEQDAAEKNYGNYLSFSLSNRE